MARWEPEDTVTQSVLERLIDRDPANSAEISRIQNAIALAEEDLKQIYALNAQAQRLQKKLPAN